MKECKECGSIMEETDERFAYVITVQEYYCATCEEYFWIEDQVYSKG